MPIITLRDYVRDDLGAGIGNIRVRAYAFQLDGSVSGTHESETFTASGDGEWQLSVDTANSPTGQYAVEIYNSVTGETRWRMPDIGLQVEYLVGPDGAAPISDQSITQAKLALGAVDTGQLADDAVTVGKIADLTVNDSNALAADTGTLQQILDGITNRIKAITGENDWYDAPDSTIAALAAGAGSGSISSPNATVQTFESHSSLPAGATGKVVMVDGAGMNDRYLARWDGSSWDLIAGGTDVETLTGLNDSQVPPGGTATVKTYLDALAYQIKRIVGESSWISNPNTDLATLASGTTSIDLPNTSSGYLIDTLTASLTSINTAWTAMGGLTLNLGTGVYFVMAESSVQADGGDCTVEMALTSDGSIESSTDSRTDTANGKSAYIACFGVLTNPGTVGVSFRRTGGVDAAAAGTNSRILAIKIS